MNRRVMAVVVAVVLLGGIGWIGLQDGNRPRMRADQVPSAVAPEEHSPSEASATQRQAATPPEAAAPMNPVPLLADQIREIAAPAPSWPDLPPVDAPLRGVFDTLRSRALRGDTSAACRLAIDLGRCRAVVLAGQDIAEGRFIAIEFPMLPRAPEARKRWLPRCQGIDAVQLREEYGMLKRAALGGHETALSLYLGGDLFVADGAANLPFLDDWRAESPRVFQAALRNGSMTALLMARSADQAYPAPFLEARQPFDIEVLRLLLLHAGTKLPAAFGVGDSEDLMARLREQSMLDAAGFAEADALARQRAAAWFGDPARIKVFADHWALKVASVQSEDGLDANAVCRSGLLPPLQPEPNPDIP